MDIRSIAGKYLRARAIAGAFAVWIICAAGASVRAEEPKAGGFWEPDFPFLEATVDARKVPALALTNNLTVRGVVLSLGNHVYACFDTDLLRLAYVWHGDGLDFASMAPISYVDLGKKNDVGQINLNRPRGEAITAVGFYAGVGGENFGFSDPRQPGLDPGELGRGPIAESLGRWEGVYAVGNQAVLHYTIAGTSVEEFLTATKDLAKPGYARNFKIGPHDAPLEIVLADYSDPHKQFGFTAGEIIGVIGGENLPASYHLWVRDENRESSGLDMVGSKIVLKIQPSKTEQKIRVDLSQPDTSKEEFVMPEFAKGGVARWGQTVVTQGTLATNGDAAFVMDRLTLPEKNPWQRRVRPSSMCFYPDGRAAVVTFDGDVWEVSGIDDGLAKLTWKRIASGLHEPQSIHFRGGNLYVFTRNEIVCLRDLNGDGEIDYYENFANCFAQSAETRDFPMDSVVAKDNGFYIAEGGQQGQFMGIHNASVLKVAADGRSAEVMARGLRGPYLGYDHDLDLLTASDQQGNWIPTSPILWLQPGKFYGFLPSTKIQPPKQAVTEPVCWIPYRGAQSTAGQIWGGDKLGPLNGQLIQLDYFHPRLLVSYFDSKTHPEQGAVSELDVPVDFPLLKGELGPKDGNLYLAGFKIWGSDANEWAGIGRLRYTGKPATQPAYARSSKDGLLVQFAEPLEPGFATNFGNFSLQRWNYRRTAAYGSGHYKLDDKAGQEFVSIHGVLISQDRKSLFLYVPEMKQVNQMELTYRLKHDSGGEFDGHVYFTVQKLEELGLKQYGLPEVDWSHWTVAPEALAQNNAPETISAADGRHRYETIGCIACHSTDGTTAGRAGPTFLGLFGKERKFATGEPEVADEAYIRESILKPQAKIVDGFQKSEVLMPSYEGVLTDAQIQSIILYIKTLSTPVSAAK